MAQVITFTPDVLADGRDVFGNDRVVTGLTTTTGTYTATGDALAADVGALAKLFGLSRVDKIIIIDAISTAGLCPRIDEVNLVNGVPKLRSFRVGAAVATPLLESQAGETVTGSFRVIVLGK